MGIIVCMEIFLPTEATIAFLIPPVINQQEGSLWKRGIGSIDELGGK